MNEKVKLGTAWSTIVFFLVRKFTLRELGYYIFRFSSLRDRGFTSNAFYNVKGVNRPDLNSEIHIDTTRAFSAF